MRPEKWRSGSARKSLRLAQKRFFEPWIILPKRQFAQPWQWDRKIEVRGTVGNHSSMSLKMLLVQNNVCFAGRCVCMERLQDNLDKTCWLLLWNWLGIMTFRLQNHNLLWESWATFLTSCAWSPREVFKLRKSEVEFTLKKYQQKRFSVYAIFRLTSFLSLYFHEQDIRIRCWQVSLILLRFARRSNPSDTPGLKRQRKTHYQRLKNACKWREHSSLLHAK